jgi:CRP/FNR family transcriptional regulator, cyclic AMP receptor protein
MAEIELTQTEMNMLRDILKKHLSELTLEVAFTHRKDFREFLEKRKEFMEEFIQRLENQLAFEKGKAVSFDRLRNVDFLQGLEEGELKSIAQFFEEEVVEGGVTLCEEGEKADRLYVLEQGKVSIRSKTGRQYDIVTPGKIVGWSFLVPPFLYTASVTTLTPSKLLVIKSPDFYYLIHKEPRMGMKVVSNLAQVIASRLI